VQLVALGGIEK